MAVAKKLSEGVDCLFPRKKRECLRCGRQFPSFGKHNRICGDCKQDEHFQEDAAMGELSEGYIYEDGPGLDVSEEGGGVVTDGLESMKKGGKPITCPRCGATVYRPGTASTHPCFIWSQEDIDMKERSFLDAVGDARRPDHGKHPARERRLRIEAQALADAVEIEHGELPHRRGEIKTLDND